jgi:hypothetical protein
MAAPIRDENEEKPLDPAVERVRRKLLRFVAINLGLLLAAVMAVLAAIVYKWEPGAKNEASQASSDPAGGEISSGEITLPPGARILSHSVSGNRLTLHVETGATASILIYDMIEGRIAGRFELKSE